MNLDDINPRRTLRQLNQQPSEEVLSERIHALKGSRSGVLGAVSRARNQINVLLVDSNNTQTVQIQFDRYKELWRKFEETHNGYIALINPNCSEFDETVQQFSKLLEENIQFSDCVTQYLQTCVPTGISLHDLSTAVGENTVKAEQRYAESVVSHKSTISRASSHSSRSSTRKRAQAVKANLTLTFAEKERQRLIEGEIRLQELDRKQKELEIQQSLQEQELDRAKRLETLRQETDRKLAEAHQQAALLQLEAELEELDELGETGTNLAFGNDVIPGCSEDALYASPSNDETLGQNKVFKPIQGLSPLRGSFPHPHEEAISLGSSVPYLITSRPNLVLPARKEPNSPSNLPNPPIKLPKPPSNLPNPPIKLPKPPLILPNPPKGSLFHQSKTPVYEAPSQRQVSSTQNTDILHLVASAMQSISSVQQRLALNLNLPTIQLEKFSGLPSEFPIFKQRFERRVLHRDDLDDGEKMLRLLQFLSGEAKDAVKTYEAVEGGVYDAMALLERRYGRKFLIIRSLIDGLTRGPSIMSKDRVALRKFADQVAAANVTLNSLNSASEINQANLVDMSKRLPKYLQEKFAVLAYETEKRENRFISLGDFTTFLDKWASVANHIINVSKVDRQSSGFKGKDDVDLKVSSAIVYEKIHSKTFKGYPCPCCSGTHPIYHCESFRKLNVEERFKLAKQKSLCYNCLKSNPIFQDGKRTNHIVKTCPSKFKCQIDDCGASHHTLLHKPKEKSPQPAREKVKMVDVSVSTGTTTCNMSDAVLLQVVPLRVIGEKQAITTYAMLDSGSEVTIVDPSLTAQVGARGHLDELVVSTVSDKNDIQRGHRVNLFVESLIDENPKRIKLSGAWSSRDLQIPLRHQHALQDTSKWPHLQDVPFPEVERKKISLIIGTNVPEAFIPTDICYDGPEAPVAIRSCLGYSIFGRAPKEVKPQCPSTYMAAVYNVCIASDDVTLNQQLESFWKLESYGTTPGRPKPMSVQDNQALEVIEKTMTKVDGHYQMGLLWKDRNVHLPDNRAIAEIRLKHLKKRLEKDFVLRKKYLAIIEDYIEKGYARKLTKSEAAARSNKTWYLPHHPVINPRKPGKLRVVFDAASKFNGTSLNDQLLQGPDLMNSLVGVLIRFRQDPVALIADVQAMFHQVKVQPDDRDALRFLWWNGDTKQPPEEYQMLVHIFGAKSSPCCANKALLQTADDNEIKYGKDVADVIRRNFYVDDLLKSTLTVKTAVELAEKLASLLAEGGFRLTKFLSNRKEVMEAIPVEERVEPTLNLDLDDLPINRVLGLCWDAQTDEFYFSSIKTYKPATKRGILSIVSSLFDPLGFLVPFILPVKVILQELWRKKVDWDEEIPENELKAWQNWLQSLHYLLHIRIPRCYTLINQNMRKVELHIFCDASEVAYAASAYIRITDDQSLIHCSFVMGKCRNSPIKRPTIPRLELLASVLAVRLGELLQCECDWKFDRIFYWTDSTTVLQYICNENRRFHRFVATRLDEIHEHTNPSQWKHVPGRLNPADDGSRGLPFEVLNANCRWLSGPDFLYQNADQWPTAPIPKMSEDDEEIVKKEINQSTIVVSYGLYQLMNRFSSWTKLQNCVSWLIRFIEFLATNTPPRFRRKQITIVERKNASRMIIKYVQLQYYKNEIAAIKCGKRIESNSRLVNLHPILKGDVLCVGGRLKNAPLVSEAVNPMIVPNQHHIATLIIGYYHRILGHAGREHVLSIIRQSYWIINGRSLTRQILRRCIVCRKQNEKPLSQMMGDLPSARVTPYEPPFTFTGLDIFGPFHVKRGRGTEKIYGCIFVCFTTRAVHIEDVGSLETDTFIQALRRFISLRGAVKEIWSDNGTNFTGGEKELKIAMRNWNQVAITQAVHENGVEWQNQPFKKWHFQPPTASHMSGVWERLVRSVKKTMKGILGHPHAYINRETLRTLFAEVLGILNTRPLCPSSDDPDDYEVLTPSHFLQQRKGLATPVGIFEDSDLYSRKRWKRAQLLANHFWVRWIREYLPLLQERKKWMHPKRNIQQGDLVLVTDTAQPRSHWNLGRVTKVIFGTDGLVRVAEIRTMTSTLLRPVTKLCLLEEANN